MDGNKVTKLFGKILDDDSLVNIPEAIKKGQDGIKEGGDKKKAFRSIAESVLPQVEKMLDGLDDIMGGDDGDEESSSSSSSSDSK